ncbi:MAG: DNA polymerase III subunit delta [Paracoccaceae bacterium]|nr:DNA polymerase III subunit delta [Paracoccaceae bacterium]
MKFSTRDLAAFIKKPDPARAGLLLYGGDPMRVALKRQELLKNLLGPGAEEEMRLTRLPAADLFKDKAALSDAVRATGFFPGPRAVLVEDATNREADIVRSALEDWQAGDAMIVVTAGALKPSGLRKLFEGAANAAAGGIYDDPPTREEIETGLREAGLAEPTREAMGVLFDLARSIDPGDFRQTVEKLALYKLGDESPATPGDVAAVAPLSVEAELDDLLHATAEARTGDICPVLRRLEAQGTTPVSIAIGATRHFRALHAAAADPGGATAGIARARPPVPWPQRDRMARQAQSWGIRKLEEALTHLMDADLRLRSASNVPEMALMERTLIRLAHLGSARG